MPLPDGVPALLNDAIWPIEVAIEVQALANLLLDRFGLSDTKWGIYLNGKIAIDVDGFVDFSVFDTSQIANYRLEKGGFSAYNKVDMAVEIRLCAIKTGTEEDLNIFLAVLEGTKQGLYLYEIVTPERVYSNANLERYSYRRTNEKGSHMIYAEMIFKEIMNIAEVATIAPKNQSAKPVVSAGQVQAK